MNKLLQGLFVVLFGFSLQAMADISVSKYAKVYKGREGLVITLLPLTPKDSKKALIEVKGMDTELDGLILLYDLVNEGSREAYTMDFDGRKSTRMRANQGYWGKWTQVYLPDVRGEFDVVFDEKASKQLNIGNFKERYLTQEKNKVQQSLAKFRKEKTFKNGQ